MDAVYAGLPTQRDVENQGIARQEDALVVTATRTVSKRA
jgi:hypothetical protein